MKAIKIQHSKDSLCDFLLAKLWQTYLLNNEPEKADLDYDTIDDLEIITNFVTNVEHTLSSTDTDLAQFGINDPQKMQQILKQAYHTLTSEHISY